MLTGTVASLIASATFFGLTLGFRPRFEISPYVAHHDLPSGSQYRFKLVNRSRRPMVDVDLKAFIDTPVKVPGSHVPVHRLRRLALNTTDPIAISGRRKGDSQARHARRILLSCDLLQEWPDDQAASLVLRITCRDGWTGTFRQAEQVFPLHTQIRAGTFGFGDSLNVE